MSFQINTNSYALNTLAQSNQTNNSISSSLEKLSSGLRINKSADDASGLLIANNLRMQASSLNQATSNAKAAVNLVQIADNALEEVDKILTTIKSKAIQSAEDGQTENTRLAIQKDVNRLIESLNNISKTTKYNGQNLLSGAFSNKEFQIGAYSNETIKMSIGNTDSNHIGHTKMETIDFNNLTTDSTIDTTTDLVGTTIAADTDVTITTDVTASTIVFAEATQNISGTQFTMNTGDSLTLAGTDTITISAIGDSANWLATGNAGAPQAGVTDNGDGTFTLTATASLTAAFEGFTFKVEDMLSGGTADTTMTFVDAFDANIGTQGIRVQTGSTGIQIDATSTGSVYEVNTLDLGQMVSMSIDGESLHTVEINNQAGTGLGALADLINAHSDNVGSTASFDVSISGRFAVAAGDVGNLEINGVYIGNVTDVVANDADGKLANAINSVSHETGVIASVNSEGILELNSADGRAISIKAEDLDNVMNIAPGDELTEIGTLTLTSSGANDILVGMRVDGAAIDSSVIASETTNEINNLSNIFTDKLLTTREGAQKAMDIADAAMQVIDAIRSDIGSTQQQLNSTINNITITAANVKIAEGGIRDVDFAVESANFNKSKLLAQSSTYALSQANEVQQNVTSLLR